MQKSEVLEPRSDPLEGELRRLRTWVRLRVRVRIRLVQEAIIGDRDDIVESRLRRG